MSEIKPLFIALEGIDGSGKSTHMKILAERLEQHGHRVHTTFEPTDGPIGKMIRSILKGETPSDHRTIAALFAADRLDHILNRENGLLKKLEDGYTVISDRYYFSSYAYHGAHVDLDWVINLNAQAAALFRPDLNVYIDVDPEITMSRLDHSREAKEIFETLENQKLVKAKYEEAFHLLSGREKVVRIDGNRKIDDVAGDVWEGVCRLIG